MKSEKVKEIKKALECCTNNKGCEPCPRLSKKPYHLDDCRFNLLADILTYINELESENEKLKQHKRELQGAQQDLTKRIAELEKEMKEHGKKKFLRGWKLGIEEFYARLKESAGNIMFVKTEQELAI